MLSRNKQEVLETTPPYHSERNSISSTQPPAAERTSPYDLEYDSSWTSIETSTDL